MKFRIKKEDGIYFAERKSMFSWWHVSGSASRNIQQTRQACKDEVRRRSERAKIIEKFKI